MKTPSPREQRMIAVLILVALVAFVWLGIVQPILAGFAERREARAQAVIQNDHNQQLAASMPLLRAAARRQREDAAVFSLPARNQDEATARLRDLVRAAANRNELVMKMSQSAEERAGWAIMRVNGVARLDQLTRFLADVQNGQPIVMVTSTSLAANAAFQTGTAGPMEVQLEVAVPYDAAAIRR
jgi:type II secretory pathway component PulM